MHSKLEQIASLINRPAQTPKGEPVMVFDWSSISAKKQSEFVSWLFGDTEGSAGFAAWIRRLPNALRACSTTQLSEFTARAAQFFERAMAAASWDSWMSSKKPV